MKEAQVARDEVIEDPLEAKATVNVHCPGCDFVMFRVGTFGNPDRYLECSNKYCDYAGIKFAIPTLPLKPLEDQS